MNLATMTREELKALRSRFLRFVKKTESCWIWNGASRAGYGVFKIDGKCVSSHRISFELYLGGIPPKHHVCHHCDNPLCVNPKHLFSGTNSDNMRDCKEKNRTRFGENSTQNKLTETQVIKAFLMCKGGLTQRRVANTLGVSQTAIYRIMTGRSWKRLTRNLLQQAAEARQDSER